MVQDVKEEMVDIGSVYEINLSKNILIMSSLNKKFIGGMNTVLSNYTFPFVSLIISFELLEIRTFGIKRFSFTPKDIIGFKIRRSGIQIVHNISNYPSFVLFNGNGKGVEKALLANGFTCSSKLDEIEGGEYQQQVTIYIFGGVLFFSFVIFLIIFMFFLLK